MKTVLLILIPVFLLSYFLAGGFSSPFPQKVIIPSGAPIVIESPSPNGAGKQLQINTFKFTHPSPSPIPPPVVPPSNQPGQRCVADQRTQCSGANNCPQGEFLVTCENHKCKSAIDGPNVTAHIDCTIVDTQPYDCNQDGFNDGIGWCNAPCLNPGNNISSCMGKPVIYLYPEIDTLVDVKLAIPGHVTVSIPTYEEEGWQDVLAHPGGRLEYRGKDYKELYYESEVNHVNPPKDGLIIEKSELYPKLTSILIQLGLKESEKQEFLDYWIPKLTVLPGNYILFSLFDPVEKERVDSVHINPEPETRIEILAYFKPLEFPILITPLILPDNPPARKGFTMVEWGGTIDH